MVSPKHRSNAAPRTSAECLQVDSYQYHHNTQCVNERSCDLRKIAKALEMPVGISEEEWPTRHEVTCIETRRTTSVG
jgi:hypothetical protein